MISEKIKIYLDRLSAAAQRPQSYLFYGPSGTGKIEAAYLFIQKISGMGKDKEFLPRVERGLHPDVVIVRPEIVEGKDGKVREKEISVGQIRETQNRLKFFPYELKQKFCIVEKAHRMNAEAGNAFLKTLEEPARESFFILLAERIDSMLPTIVSRCASLRFFSNDFVLKKEESRTLLRKTFKGDIPEKFELAEKMSKNRNETIGLLGDWEIAAGDTLGKVVREGKRKQAIEVAGIIRKIRNAINIVERPSTNARAALEGLLLEIER